MCWPSARDFVDEYDGDVHTSRGSRMPLSRRALTLFASITSLAVHLAAQPALTSWRLNTTGETGTYTLQNGTKGTLPANVQLVQYDATYVYVSASGIPSYDIGPFG